MKKARRRSLDASEARTDAPFADNPGGPPWRLFALTVALISLSWVVEFAREGHRLSAALSAIVLIACFWVLARPVRPDNAADSDAAR